MKPYSALLLLFVFFGCGTSKVLVTKHSGQNLSGKLFYALPRNTLIIDIKVTETKYVRGDDFNISADCIDRVSAKFGLDKDVLKGLNASTSFLTSEVSEGGITVTQGARADVDKIFMVNVIPKYYQDNVVGLNFNKDWILTEASLSSENKSFEIFSTAASSLIGVIGSLAKGPAFTDTLDPCLSKYAKLISANTKFENFVKEAEKSGFNIESFNAAKTQLQNEIDKEFKKVFYTKKEKSYTARVVIDIDSTLKDKEATPLFALSQSGGLEMPTSLEKYIIEYSSNYITFKTDISKSTPYFFEYKILDNDVYAKIKTSINNPPGETGLVYNIPATIECVIKDNTKKTVMAAGKYKFAQFGSLGYMNPKFNKSSVVLDSLTGSLIKVSGESKSIATSTVSGIPDLVKKAQETFKKPTEEEELEKKIKLIKLKKEYKELTGE